MFFFSAYPGVEGGPIEHICSIDPPSYSVNVLFKLYFSKNHFNQNQNERNARRYV